MIIKDKGSYKLLNDFKVRMSWKVFTLSKGTILHKNQIDEDYHKVISPELKDWVFGDLPVKQIGGKK